MYSEYCHAQLQIWEKNKILLTTFNWAQNRRAQEFIADAFIH